MDINDMFIISNSCHYFNLKPVKTSFLFIFIPKPYDLL